MSQSHKVLKLDEIEALPGPGTLSGSVYYELACLEASEGHLGEARTALDAAIARNPKCAGWARGDDELAAVVSSQ